MREIHDHYFHEAKRDGYRSRAAYKLIEIDDRRKILAPGNAVLDCGAAPGSWLQVAARRVGPKGVVVGVDLQAIASNFAENNIVLIQGDLNEIDAPEYLEHIGREQFNVILSDMAPSTTGNRSTDHHRSSRLCHAVLDRCPALLQPSGNIVMKVLEGETYPDLIMRTRSGFTKVKGMKPKASRGESTEMYVVGIGFSGSIGDADPPDKQSDDPRDVLPTRKPSTGWGASPA